MSNLAELEKQLEIDRQKTQQLREELRQMEQYASVQLGKITYDQNRFTFTNQPKPRPNWREQIKQLEKYEQENQVEDEDVAPKVPKSINQSKTEAKQQIDSKVTLAASKQAPTSARVAPQKPQQRILSGKQQSTPTQAAARQASARPAVVAKPPPKIPGQPLSNDLSVQGIQLSGQRKK